MCLYEGVLFLFLESSSQKQSVAEETNPVLLESCTWRINLIQILPALLPCFPESFPLLLGGTFTQEKQAGKSKPEEGEEVREWTFLIMVPSCTPLLQQSKILHIFFHFIPPDVALTLILKA